MIENHASRLEPEDLCEPEWAEWYRLTPAARWELTPEDLSD
jgi:hypothetical protein